jgi:phage shock protein E
MKRILLSLFVLASVILHGQTTVRHVDAATFRKSMSGKDYEIIDLRTDAEIARKGKIKGARQIDFLATDAEARINALDRKKTYLIYCAGGGRSGECATLMEKLGFREVVDLEKGYDDWARRGFEIEKK